VIELRWRMQKGKLYLLVRKSVEMKANKRMMRNEGEICLGIVERESR